MIGVHYRSPQERLHNNFFSDSQNSYSLKYYFRHLEYQGDLKQVFQAIE